MELIGSCINCRCHHCISCSDHCCHRCISRRLDSVLVSVARSAAVWRREWREGIQCVGVSVDNDQVVGFWRRYLCKLRTYILVPYNRATWWKVDNSYHMLSLMSDEMSEWVWCRLAMEWSPVSKPAREEMDMRDWSVRFIRSKSDSGKWNWPIIEEDEKVRTDPEYAARVRQTQVFPQGTRRRCLRRKEEIVEVFFLVKRGNPCVR